MYAKFEMKDDAIMMNSVYSYNVVLFEFSNLAPVYLRFRFSPLEGAD